ncbi:biotin/lipoyl-containing protein, partial [Fodinibius sp. SL11]|uniref:biotin/lipoyl-containing protein n=1 Tax=Fodinibius sp. SL11 TaxID=3425690 RepID=UPI003F883E8B
MARVEVEMPQMGESVMEGTVIEWAKEIGDEVEEDETLLEIATDKVDTEVPSPQAGILIEKLAEEGDTIEVGQPIAVIETDAEAADTSAGGGSTEEEAQADEPETQEEPQQEEVVAEESSEEESGGGSADEEGERIEVEMPQMGESVMEGTVIEWAKAIGDEVEEDETLLEISTDKVDTEVPSPQAGTLVEILVEEGDTVEVGQTIAVIATGKAASGSASASTATSDTQKKETTSTQEQKSQPAAASASTNGSPSGGSEPQRIGSDGRFYSPLVRSIAKEEGISQEELENIEGSGQGGRVSKEDVMNYLEDRKAGKTQQTAAQPSGGLSKPSTKTQSAAKGKEGA